MSFDHVSDGRIRHGTKVLRWRDDKAPEDCTFDQLDADRQSREAGRGAAQRLRARDACTSSRSMR